jgi:hypothetical protein
MVEDKETVSNKTTVSYKTMIKNKKLDSFFTEDDEEDE